MSEDVKNFLKKNRNALEEAANKLKKKLQQLVGKFSGSDFIVQQKSETSLAEKLQRKNRSLLTITDIVRGVFLVGYKYDLETIISFVQKTWKSDIVKIESKESGHYRNAYHIDIKIPLSAPITFGNETIDHIVCEVQIMYKQMYSYKTEMGGIYKGPGTEEEKRNQQEALMSAFEKVKARWEEINRKKQKRHRTEKEKEKQLRSGDIDAFSALIDLFYKIAMKL